ncbi:FAD-dependent oxidoreductase [Utexia brackfieldae]|uniref:FAD-dependent oxidoreductase n=1 Tax=Utexia brackfieldae TaxID=3074108 RepID=UPI00370DD8BE
MVRDFDVIIIGAGIVGLATACALGQQSLRVAVIDDKIAPAEISAHPAIRASAINGSSQHYFEQLGIWQSLLSSQRVLSFEDISVKEANGFARLSAHSHDYHFNNLGHIIENELMVQTLYQKACTYDNVCFFQQKAQHLYSANESASVQLADESILTAQLMVAADGANSWVRQNQQIKLWQYHYRHHALIATVKTAMPHEACARQLFYPDGIIAFLPLWQSDMSCLVWSAKPDEAERLMAQDAQTFNQSLTAATAGWLGDCQLASEKLLYPLTARYTTEFVKHRLILIGDAAHTIHPLAGQGVNLGLRDSALLAQTIQTLFATGKDIGLKPAWQSYQRSRNKDVLMMLAAMQGIESVFDGQFVIKKWLRGAGMNMIDQVPFIKKHVIKYALGL